MAKSPATGGPVPKVFKPKEQRKHNPKTRKPHPVPFSFNRPTKWTYWQGSKEHLFPVGIECKSTAGVPAKFRDTVKIVEKAKQFRDRNTCVSCFYRYADRERRHRESFGPPPRRVVEVLQSGAVTIEEPIS